MLVVLPPKLELCCVNDEVLTVSYTFLRNVGLWMTTNFRKL